MNRKPRGRQFAEPAFWVNAILAIIALIISIKACSEATKIRRIEEIRIAKEYSEELSITGYMRIAENLSCKYTGPSATSDTAMSHIPSVADFAITNNSQQPITIQEVNYVQFGCINDSLPLPCFIDQHGPTKRKFRPPIDLVPGETIRFEDTLYICVPGRYHPATRVGGDSLYWMRWPLAHELMWMASRSREYAYLLGSQCYEISETYVKCYMRSSHGKEFIFSYFLMRDLLVQ